MDNQPKKYCECGCGGLLRAPKSAEYPYYLKKRRFIKGHNKPRLGKYTAVNPVRRRYHETARTLSNIEYCSINTKDCLGIVEVAHIDQNYKNNDLANLKPLCAAHHRILDSHYKNGMRFEDLFKLKLDYYISSGKRRYKKSSFGGF